MSENTLIVGRCKENNQRFIGVPDSHYEPIIATLTNTRKHAIKIEDADLEWLVFALCRQMGRDRAEIVAGSIEDLFCFSCDGSLDECDECDGTGFTDF